MGLQSRIVFLAHMIVSASVSWLRGCPLHGNLRIQASYISCLHCLLKLPHHQRDEALRKVRKNLEKPPSVWKPGPGNGRLAQGGTSQSKRGWEYRMAGQPCTWLCYHSGQRGHGFWPTAGNLCHSAWVPFFLHLESTFIPPQRWWAKIPHSPCIQGEMQASPPGASNAEHGPIVWEGKMSHHPSFLPPGPGEWAECPQSKFLLGKGKNGKQRSHIHSDDEISPGRDREDLALVGTCSSTGLQFCPLGETLQPQGPPFGRFFFNHYPLWCNTLSQPTSFW